VRGLEREKIVTDDEARKTFISRLGKVASGQNWQVGDVANLDNLMGE
jgi:hypothetical protein